MDVPEYNVMFGNWMCKNMLILRLFRTFRNKVSARFKTKFVYSLNLVTSAHFPSLKELVSILQKCCGHTSESLF
jgi:hypothetical protein